MEREKIEALKREKGLDRVAVVRLDSVAEVVLRPPTRAEWRRFKEQGQDAQRRIGAAEQLVKDCVVHPEAAEFEKLLDRYPGIVDRVENVVADLAGIVEDVHVEKF